MRHTALSLASATVLFVTSFITTAIAQQPVLKLTAISVNVSEPGNNVHIEVLRWSTDQERNQLVAALTPPAPAPAPAPADVPTPPAAAAPAAGAEGAATRGGRGGARGGAAGARGGGARGGRGGGNAAAPVDPIAAFTAAIGKAPTIGYIWTNEVTGYAIKHALRLPSSDGVERIILASNRRIGANARSWTPVKGTPTPYEFTLLEIRLPSSGAGEAKASLTTTIAVDNDAKTIGLENYVAAPALFANVRRP
ncbi:MAG TPA: hypothetical protein VFR18_09415 [Terriglobia bacterium]|nr:hypothetical protein [Terriglobia bacterium]